jgi:hypothetical protein
MTILAIIVFGPILLIILCARLAAFASWTEKIANEIEAEERKTPAFRSQANREWEAYKKELRHRWNTHAESRDE